MISADLSPFAAALKKRLTENRTLIEQAAQSTANRLAMQGVRDIQAEMRRVFDRPRRQTLNALKWVDNSGPGTATIAWRDSGEVGKGVVSPSRWLRMQIVGGPRGQKGSERRLQFARGGGGQAVYLVPTRYAPTDAYGNVPGLRMVKILSDLQSLGGDGQGFDGNRRADGRSRGRRRRESYFAIWPGTPGRRLPSGKLMPNNLPPAIYQRFGTGTGEYIRPIFIFARSAPVYRPRLDLVEVVRRTVATKAGEFFLRAMRRERVFTERAGDSAMEVPNVRL